MAKTSTTPLVQASPQTEPLRVWVEKRRLERGFSSNSQLASAAETSPSTLSMILSGRRPLTAKMAQRLAQQLCPPEENLEDFVQQLLAHADHALAPLPPRSESVVDRLKQGKNRVRIALVVADPFLNYEKGGSPDGMAWEIFRYICRLLGLEPGWQQQELKDLPLLFSEMGFDLAAVVFPTFERHRFMAFSRPLPFLRLPLSAVVTKGTGLTVEQVLAWEKTTSEGLDRVRILLVRGGIGCDFIDAFLPGVRREDSPRVEYEAQVSPRDLSAHLEESQEPFLVFSDMATCVTLCEINDSVEPLPTADLKNLPAGATHPWVNPVEIRRQGTAHFPILALYPLVFALPKADQAWQSLFNEALDTLVNEGARFLYSMFQRNLRFYPAFRHFCSPQDEDRVSAVLREKFQHLFTSG